MDKKDIRKQLTQEFKRRCADGVLPEQNTATVCAIRNHPLYQRAKSVLLYSALWDEVNLSDLFSDSKRFILPTVTGDDLELHEWIGNDSTHTGAFGITESSGPLVKDYGNIDLALIPGRAFTHDGKRLGRGKGYYDRLLPRLHCPTLGICFPFQLFEELPSESHDRNVDEVVSGLKA